MNHARHNDFRFKWWALFGLSLLAFTAFLDFTIVSTAIPFIQKAFNAPVSKLQWVTGIYGMLMSMTMIIIGRVGDIFGRRRVFYAGFVLFAIAAVGAGATTNIEWLIFFRGVQGFAGATIFTQSVALLPLAFPEDEQEKAVGIYSALTGFGLAVGPFLGGALIALLSWRWIFWINIPIVFVGIGCCFFSLKESPKPKVMPKLDWAGFLLITVGIGCLIYGLIHGSQFGWQVHATWVNLIIGVTALILLIFVERRVQEPLLELGLFKNRHACLAALICVIAGMILFIFFSFFDALYLRIIRNQTAFIVGLTLLAVPLMQVILSLFLPKLLKLFGVMNFIVLGLFLAFVSSVLHIFIGDVANFSFVLVALLLMGIAWGIGNTGAITAINQSVPSDKVGGSIGTVFTLWNMAGPIFLAIGTVLFQYFETIKMNSMLLKHHVTLSAHQKALVASLLSDPEHAASHLKAIAGPGAHAILASFKAAFLSGYHAVGWMMTVVTLLTLILGVILKKRGSLQ